MPVKILLFNNQIYGLTKGQASPTSELGKVTKSTPFGSIDAPFNPISLALGAEATFVARTIDTDKHHLPAVLRAAAAHEGAALVEIYQNCPVFNDGAFDALRDKKAGAVNRIPLEHGQPIRFGVEGENGVVRGADGVLRIAAVADVGEDALVVHDAHRDDPSFAFELSRLSSSPDGPTPIGIFRDVSRPVSGQELTHELAVARAGADDATLDARAQRWGHVDGLLARRSAKYSTYPPDVLPAWVAEMDFDLAPPVKAALRAAIDNDDAGYLGADHGWLLSAFADFAARRLGWKVDVVAGRRGHRRDGGRRGAARGADRAGRRRDRQPADLSALLRRHRARGAAGGDGAAARRRRAGSRRDRPRVLGRRSRAAALQPAQPDRPGAAAGGAGGAARRRRTRTTRG